MEALLLRDAVYVSERYEELQDAKRPLAQSNVAASTRSVASTGSEASTDWQEQEHSRILQRAKALEAKGPTPQLNKNFSVLKDILMRLYARDEHDRHVISPPTGNLKRHETVDVNCPVPLKEMPQPTQVVLRMFFRTCRSLREPMKLAANYRLSVQIASKLPVILTAMPSCVLSPGLADEAPAELEDGGVCNVFYQLFQLFEELLGVENGDGKSSLTPGVGLSAGDRAIVIVAYVALSLKWGRLGYLLKGVKLLLENAQDLSETRFEPLLPLFRELAATQIERPQIAFGEEEQQCGYLMSFGKGDHGKLGHGQCAHVSCQEGNCTENKMVPTMIAATRDVVFRKIDSLSTHSIAITAKGEAMAWGNGDKYRLGHGSSAKEYTPRTIEFLNLKGKVRDLACGLGHTLALMDSGELFAWGNGSNGRLGLGDTNDRSSPTRVSIPTTSDKQEAGEKEVVTDPVGTPTSSVRFQHIFCGASHSLGLSWDGRAYAWGKNNQGQCGHGHTNDQWTIQEIESFYDTEEGEEDERVVFAAGGWEHTLFCTASGRVYSCGCGYKDSRRTGIPPVLGHGDCDRRLKPTMVQTLEDSREEIVKVACGWDHSLAVSASGRVYTWGSGTNGKLGHGDEESFDIPTLVRTIEGKSVKDAKAGCEHTVFLTHDYELWTCGQGDSGRLGHGDSQTRKRPTKVELFTESGLKPVALAVGDKYNLVLVTDDGGQGAHDNESGPDSVPKAAYRVSDHGLSHGTNVHHGRQRSVLHKKHNQQMQFGANWVLSIAAGSDPEGTPATKAQKDGFTPDSAHSVALFIAGHMDRLASDYIVEEPEPTSEKLHEPNAIETHSKVQSVLLPFAVDTSCESLSALLRLLQWATNTTKTKDKSGRAEKFGLDDLSVLQTQERMGLALSCLRILQLNLKKALDTAHAPGEIVDGTELRSKLSIDLFSRIHELLDSLAGLKETDIVYRFDEHGVRQSRGVNDVLAVAKAISQEAASALKMGFCMFYPTKVSRCSLLWEILDGCKVDSPSMRTVILSDQLCKDSIMTEIFRSLPSNGLLSLTDHVPGDLPNDGATGKDIFEIKSLMLLLLKRSGCEAIKQLDNEAFTDFTHKPDCFLRLLHVLQTHYVSIAHQSALQCDKMNGKQVAHEQIMGVLLEYVDSLMAEALTVLKRLHKGSRQHEEIITWRLNGSFFHMVLPSAIECLSVLLLPSTNREGVYRSTQNLVLVERILPNLHVMLKMLDEVSWKMHSAGDVGNQAHHDRVSSTFPHAGQEHNWFIDLGDACAVLCGKLSCELLYPSRMETQDIASRGTYCALVLSEGRLCRKENEAMSFVKDQISRSARNILEWERLGVFEVEDELVGSEPDPSASRSSGSSAAGSHGFLVQFSEIGVSSEGTSFWSWVAASLSHDVEFSTGVQRLLTLVASISAWHLSLVEELQHAYELYDVSTRNSPPTDKLSPVPACGVWGMLSALIRSVKQTPWINNTLDSGAMENAVKTSRLLLSLQPNPALMPQILRSEAEELPTNAFRAWEDESLSALLMFLTSSVDIEAVQRSLAVKEFDSSLVQTGICILHDLLRKLTTSSAKSCLLDEFVAAACVPSQMSAPTAAAMRQITLNQGDDKHISKAIENLFIRLARIISSDDASFELKKKALLAWTVPLGTSKQSVPSAVALIAKSGIVSTLVELLLDEVNVPESFSDDKLLNHTIPPGSEPRLSAKLAAIKSLMLDQTPTQVSSVLAWEAFSAISLQLSRSETFAEHKANLLLRSAGSSLHEREPLTPRSISLSPRRRLTLPKKMIVSTIDDIIEQMIDGLFLMLKGAKERLEALDNADLDKVKGKEGGMNDTAISRETPTEEVASQMRINDIVLFRLKQQHMAESTCGQVLRLLCQLVGSSEQASGESSLARISFSDRWITLFTDMLLGTCRDHDVSQVYLCYLLQNVLPRAPPSPNLDIQALGRSLFSSNRSRNKSASVAELFDALNVNDPKQHSSSLSVRRQNETLCRILQQHGILSGKSCGESLFVSNDAPDATAVDTFTSKIKHSMKFAASVHLIQKLCSTSSWRSRTDVFFAGSTAIFQSIGGFEEALQSPESNSVDLEDLRAVISTVAGYSEEAVNCHRALVLDAAVLPLPLQKCSTPFYSVIHGNGDQVAQIQSLVSAVMKEGSRQALYFSARKDILLRCHNDVAAVNAKDLQVGSVIHLRARVLRVLMTALLRENSAASTTNKTYHRFLLENATTCDDLLRAAASYTKEDVAAMLGPDAKIALKLRRVRRFVREVLRGSKRRQSGQLAVSVSELEIVQWSLWEELNTRSPSIRRTPWWQQRGGSNGKVTLEIVGGDVEMCDLKVKALEHFPTVRLAQANIRAGSGLWFFEVVILTDGLMQIGYVDGEFTADPLQGQGVGDHTNSWAYDGFRCKKWNVSSYDYGEQWKVDDVVGVLLDTDRMELSYFLNGKFLGVAFSSIPMTSSSQMCPAASLNVQQSAEFNFGKVEATTPPTNEEGVQMSGGFKHLPSLDNVDQARLRPVLSALQTRRTSKSDGGLNTDSLDNEPKDASEDWGSSSCSDTEDGEIPLEDSENLPDLMKTLVPGSRDGRETRAADQNDEENSQRRRDLVDGLTGLGFPLEWATRCAAETRLPMDETGAVAWILEQMEKAGLNGAIGLPPTSSTSGDVMEHSSQPSALWNTRVQLPNLVANSSADELETTGSSLLADTSVSTPLEQMSGNETTGIRDNQSGSAFSPPSSSLSEYQGIVSGSINAFLEADKDDQQSNDAASETFQSGSYRQHLQHFNDLLDLFDEPETSTSTRALDRKTGVDDLVPLGIAIDTTLYVAYSRQAFTSLLLLALHQEELGAVYQMLRRLLSSEGSSFRFRQFLKLATGLDTIDAVLDVDNISEGFPSERSLALQKAIAALLHYEACEHVANKDFLERPPFLDFLCQEMSSQCDRSLNFTRGKHDKNTVDSTSILASPAWFAWVSGIILRFIESRIAESSRSLDLFPFDSSPFLENLMTIAASPSNASKAWKYVAFRLISRLLWVIRSCEGCGIDNGTTKSADTPSSLIVSAQFASLTELFALRHRREMFNRVFFSDITSALFTLLVRSVTSSSVAVPTDKQQHCAKSCVNLRVNSYSSTQATISWDQVSRTVSEATVSGGMSDDLSVPASTEINSSILLLEVKRCCPQMPECSSEDSNNITLKALPSKGTFTIRNLLPDTQYRLRLAPTQPQNDNYADAAEVPSVDARLLDDSDVKGAEVILQTPREPVFELDRESMGKNMVVFNRNLSAKNTVNKKWHSVRASIAFDEGVHQWQVRLDTCVSKNIFIGVCTAEASMENYVGSDAYGYGFLANRAVWHNKAKLHSYGEIFKQGDTIQVTLDCNAKTLAFSRNGEYLGIAASNMRAGVIRSGSSGSNDNCKWYPAFSMYNKDDKVTLIPPAAGSTFSLKEGRPQNASTLELIEEMKDVLAYDNQLSNVKSSRSLEKAFEAFDGWRRQEKIFREIALGQVIVIDTSKSATEKYGLVTGDAVFTSKGQCSVLGEYRHELWYEVDEGGSSSLFGASTSQLASWSLSTCREILSSPDEYPVHRHHKYKLDLESSTNSESATIDTEQQNQSVDPETLDYQAFLDVQERWGDNDVNAAALDAKLIAELDAIAMSQACASPLQLSFADISTTLLLEKIYSTHGVSAERGSSQTLARIGLLLHVNRCLYNVVRVALPRITFATTQGTSEGLDIPANQPSSTQKAGALGNTECCQVSPVAALMNSPHWALNDPSAFTRMSALAAQLLFSSQKEKLICEELRRTKTTSRASDNLLEPSENEDGGSENDLPSIKMVYPQSRAVPFWELSPKATQKQRFRLPLSPEASVFVQLAKQLSAQDPRQWRRESSQPFEAIPISQAFRVHVESPSTESCGSVSEESGLEKKTQQQQDEDDEHELQQPSSKQTSKYLNLFESAVRELLSPCFPLFAPVEASSDHVRFSEDKPRRELGLDINLDLFSASALAHSRLRAPQLLLWYFCVGQLLGIAWRSKVLLPLQYVSKAFWEELVSPADPVPSELGERSKTREVAIRAVREGLFSIIPSRCVALLSGSNPSLRERLSDLDVSYVARLERHATYTVPSQSHHDVFWKVLHAFTSVERRMLEQFINPERRNGTRQVEVLTCADDTSSIFVLEVAEALADGRDHPDSCYPVVVPIGAQSSRLHLPAYSSAQTLRQKLLLAMTNIPFM